MIYIKDNQLDELKRLINNHPTLAHFIPKPPTSLKSLLHAAIQESAVDVVNYLLVEQKVDPNQTQDISALKIALSCYNSRSKFPMPGDKHQQNVNNAASIVALLIDNGARHRLSSGPNAKTTSNQSILLQECELGNCFATKLLLELIDFDIGEKTTALAALQNITQDGNPLAEPNKIALESLTESMYHQLFRSTKSARKIGGGDKPGISAPANNS